MYKSLFLTTNNNKENMYCEYKGKISNFLNSCVQESLHLDLVMIPIICFCILKILIVYSEFPPEIYAIGYYRVYIRKINHS
jgi:hypothetical protein